MRRRIDNFFVSTFFSTVGSYDDNSNELDNETFTM